MDSSIKIKNNSSSWYYNQPLYMRVAKPNTEEYARQKQNDWYFRCQKEFENCKSLGGSIWFPTLTFRNDDLPSIDLSDYCGAVPYHWTPKNVEILRYTSEPWIDVPLGSTINCFDADLVRRFIKTLREILTRLGYNANGMQYIICAEYGKNTKRPHYHALIFIYDRVPSSVMLDCLRRAWHYGFIGHGKQGLEVKTTHAIRYCTKYVSKDSYYASTQKIKNVGLSLENFIYQQQDYEPKVLRHMLRNYMPRPIISHGLGKCYFDNYLLKLSECNLIPLLTKEKTITLPLDKSNQFTLPQYYVNKFCYEVNRELSKYNDKTIAILTPLGEKVYCRKLSLRLSATEKKLQDLTPQLCGDYWSDLHSVDLNRLAQYITYFRYLPYRGEPLDINQIWSFAPELMWSMCFDRKENHYVVEKWFDDACQEIENLEIGGSCADAMLAYAAELVENRMPVAPKKWSCWCDLPEFSDYEKAAIAYDKVLDWLFEQKENDKRMKREKKADDKYVCLTTMPYLIKEYESI